MERTFPRSLLGSEQRTVGSAEVAPHYRLPAFTSSSHWLLRKGIGLRSRADVEAEWNLASLKLVHISGMNFMKLRKTNNALATVQLCPME